MDREGESSDSSSGSYACGKLQAADAMAEAIAAEEVAPEQAGLDMTTIHEREAFIR